ncbi:MAG: dTMP kinase [Phototrophicaceae bacterium]
MAMGAFMFITFEGIEGSGKTTQARLTADYLRHHGHNVLLTREPGGTPIGDQIRGILLDNMDNVDMHDRTELLLFCASRAQLVSEVIAPHLEQGGVVICDRYIDSTMAYQGYGHGLNLKFLRQLNSFATNGLTPDLTVFLDITPEKALRRRAAGTLFGEEWNRLDDMALAFHQRVYKGYRDLILAEPARFVAVDAADEPDQVQARIRATLSEWLELPASRSTGAR